jgi:tRNA threonylcarbamoyladenosine biosynthesis protein TsaB
MTASKGWAEVYGRPIAAVSVLEAVAAQACELAGAIVPVIDARGGQVFSGVYRSKAGSSYELELAREECVLPAAELAGWLDSAMQSHTDAIVVSPMLDVIRPLLADRGREQVQMRGASSALAPFIGRVGYSRALRGNVTDALRLEANYVRRPDAEVKYRG